MFTSVSILFGFAMFLQYKASSLTHMTDLANDKRIKIDESIKSLNEKILFVNRQKAIANDIFSRNLTLRDAIRTIFNLVPDEITLKKVEMTQKELILQGITPSKEIYNFQLLAPLKSIFTKNTTTFYMLENGWFSFVSVNKIEDYVGVME
jgi:hypothetical protein